MAVRRRRVVGQQPALKMVEDDPGPVDDEALAELSRLEEPAGDSEPDEQAEVGEEPPEEPLPPGEPAFDDDVTPEPSGPRVTVGKPWGEVVRHVYDLDIEKTYRMLNGALSLGDGATDYGTVLRALDNSAQSALLAARLVRAAKLEDERVAAETAEQEELMRRSARVALEQEKAAAKAKGGSVKPPTIQEIEDRMIAVWPDKVFDLRRVKSEMHGALRAMEALEKAWWERCAALRKISERFIATSRA